eukprot:86047-Rhodomonas_salina.1
MSEDLPLLAGPRTQTVGAAVNAASSCANRLRNPSGICSCKDCHATTTSANPRRKRAAVRKIIGTLSKMAALSPNTVDEFVAAQVEAQNRPARPRASSRPALGPTAESDAILVSTCFVVKPRDRQIVH